MKKNSYHNGRCDTCGEFIMEQGKYCYEILIYQQKYVKGYDKDTKMEIQPISYTDLNLFCEKCVNEEKVFELIYKNFRDKIEICRSCQKITNYQESIVWAVIVQKMNIAESVGCFAPVWGDSLYNYCEECGNNKDLYIDAFKCVQDILEPEVKNNIEPYKGTFIPSQFD